jgi:hypothetical protein
VDFKKKRSGVVVGNVPGSIYACRDVNVVVQPVAAVRVVFNSSVCIPQPALFPHCARQPANPLAHLTFSAVIQTSESREQAHNGTSG